MNSFHFQEVYKSVTAYLKANPKTDVIITSGVQTITDAIISAVSALNLSIPKDIKLMVFDNDFSSTELTLLRPYVIQQNAYQIGYQSAATLYTQIYGDLRTKIIRLPADIIDFININLEFSGIHPQITYNGACDQPSDIIREDHTGHGDQP